jgi:hypothetical protein
MNPDSLEISFPGGCGECVAGDQWRLSRQCTGERARWPAHARQTRHSCEAAGGGGTHVRGEASIETTEVKGKMAIGRKKSFRPDLPFSSIYENQVRIDVPFSPVYENPF